MMQLVLDGLTRIIGPIATLSRDRRELKETALMSIGTALNETYFYYRELHQGEPRSIIKEHEIATFWSAAAISIRHFDSELAEICAHKSTYWINPELYERDERISQYATLDNVRKAFIKLL